MIQVTALNLTGNSGVHQTTVNVIGALVANVKSRKRFLNDRLELPGNTEIKLEKCNF